MSLVALAPQADPVDQRSPNPPAHSRSPRMFDADGTSAIAGTVH